jgi:hypothetical protein
VGVKTSSTLLFCAQSEIACVCGGEVVHHQVDPQARVITHPDLLEKGEHLAGVLVLTQASMQPV